MPANEHAYEAMKALRPVIMSREVSRALDNLTDALRAARDGLALHQDASVMLLGREIGELASQSSELRRGLAVVDSKMAALL